MQTKLTPAQKKLVWDMITGGLLVHHNFSYKLYTIDGMKQRRVSARTVGELEAVLCRTHLEEHNITVSTLSRWVKHPKDIENLWKRVKEQ